MTPASRTNFEVKIPKPVKRHASVVSENGSHVIVPPAPLKRQALSQLPNVNNIISNERSDKNLSFNLPTLPAKLSTPEVKNFLATKVSAVSEFSPAIVNKTNPGLLKRSSKLSLNKNRIPSSATSTPQTIERQDQIIVPGEKKYEEILKGMLPYPYTYEIESIESLQPYHKNIEYDQSEMFTTTIRMNLRTKEEALKWLQDFQDSSLSDWRARKCFKENTPCVIFKKGYRCVHNTQAQYRHGTEAHKKHTACDAYLSITIKNFEMKRSSDKLLKKYPCVIILHHCHNHPIEASDVLRFRRPTPRIVEMFLDMFRKEHSPSSALSLHQYDLQIQHPDNWFEILADGAECPNLQWCYHLYYKTFLKEYGSPSGEGMVQSLFAAIEKYNSESGSTCAAALKYQDNDLIVALCSPLMKRVHKLLKSSGEINFLDSGGSMDRHNTRIFTILAPSVAGALPLGIIFTSSESEDVFTTGMKLLQSIMPPDAFFNKGPAKGPQVIMTDDSRPERNTLRNCFPGVILLLCFFHVLQAFWTYVWEYKHNVIAAEKEEVFFIFKDWCYSKTVEEFEKRFHDILSNPLYSKNPLLVKHVKGLFDRAREWALCYRTELLIRGNNTNNYSEITIRQFKDQVLHRLKAYSVVQLFDFFTSRLEAYFERRIAAVVNNRRENYYTSKHHVPPSKLKTLQCAKSSHQYVYVVKNVEKKTEYIVDMQLEICSCPIGFNGAPCKHQFAVAKTFNLSTSQFLPYEDEAAKMILHQIMTTAPPKQGWYASLKAGPVVTSPTEAELGEQSISSASPEDNFCDEDVNVPLIEASCSDELGLDAERNQHTLELWESVNLFMVNQLRERPEVYGRAVEHFVSQFNKARDLSENVVLSALHNFSINTSGPKSMRKGKYIRVNKAAQIRRKYASMAGRKLAQQGRPAKAAFTNEHGYSVCRQIVPAWNRCSKKKGPVPHKLSVRIDNQSQKRQHKVK